MSGLADQIRARMGVSPKCKWARDSEPDMSWEDGEPVMFYRHAEDCPECALRDALADAVAALERIGLGIEGRRASGYLPNELGYRGIPKTECQLAREALAGVEAALKGTP